MVEIAFYGLKVTGFNRSVSSHLFVILTEEEISVQLEVLTQSVEESEGVATLQVTLDQPISEDIQFIINAVDDTATGKVVSLQCS